MNTKIIILVVIAVSIVAVGLQYYLNNYGGAAVFQSGSGDQAACSSICQESCSSFSNPTDTQQCLRECAQFCVEGY